LSAFVIKAIKTNYGRQTRAFLIASAVALVFSIIYNQNSHGVYSSFMTLLCLWPLAGAAYSFVWGKISGFQNKFSNNLVCAGFATLTMGSMLRGIVEIAGTTSGYIIYFFIVGMVLILGGIVSSMLSAAQKFSC